MQSEYQGSKIKLAIRLVALSMLLFNFYFAVAYFDPYGLITFFTNWNLEVTFGLILIIIWKSFDKEIGDRKGWLCAIHLLTEVSCVTNLLTVIVYFSVIHPDAMERFKDNQMRILHMYLVHTFPAFGLGVIFATTDIQMTPSHCKSFVPLGLIYAITNYIGTLQRGKPLYFFLTWEDYKSPLICVALTFIFTSLYWLVAHASILFNQSKKNEKKGTKVN